MAETPLENPNFEDAVTIEANERITQLKADLAKYGGHPAECASRFLVEPEGVVTGEHRPCDCGWAAIEKGL